MILLFYMNSLVAAREVEFLRRHDIQFILALGVFPGMPYEVIQGFSSPPSSRQNALSNFGLDPDPEKNIKCFPLCELIMEIPNDLLYTYPMFMFSFPKQLEVQLRTVALTDVEYENLLENLPNCLLHIEEGLEKTQGSILVHW
jgi:hypothetical protein